MAIDAIVAVFGLIIGSFFNVLIYRLPRNESVVFPASHCPACGKPISPLHNIPILSYCLLRGRCADCKVAISFIYPLIECITALSLMAIWVLIFKYEFLDAGNRLAYIGIILKMLCMISLIPVFVIDLRHYIIPNAITFPGIVLGLGTSFLPGGITPLQSLIGCVGCAGFLFTIGFIGQLVMKKEALGMGDVKLMACIGAVFGFKVCFLSIFIGSFIGALGGIIYLAVTKSSSRDHPIPFGPFLAVGTWTAVLFGDKLISEYFNLMGSISFFLYEWF